MLSNINVRANRKSNRRAFTLIELLVVILILAILMAVALPLYLNSVNDSKRAANLSNMKTIANAVIAERVRTGATDYASLDGAVADNSKLTNLAGKPVGPDNESYTVKANGASFTVSCVKTGSTGCENLPDYDPQSDQAVSLNGGNINTKK